MQSTSLTPQSRHRIGTALTLIPVLVQAVLLGWRLRDWVPVWAWYPDPGYQYLLNGGVIITGGSPGHTDHPGTSLQWLAGLAEIATYWLRRPDVPFHLDLVRTPEVYARSIAWLLSALFIAALTYAVLRMRRWLGAAPALLFGLLLLWMLAELSMGTLKIVPESIVLTMSIAALGIVAPNLARRSQPLHWSAVVAAGVIAAVGFSGKVTFAPLVLVIAILLPWRQLLAFIATWAVALAVISIPIYPRLASATSWFTGILTSSGRHGQTGEVHVITRLLDSWQVLHLTVRWFFFVLVLLLIASLVIALLSPTVRSRGLWRPLLALVVGCAIVLATGFKAAETRDFIMLMPLVAALAAVALRGIHFMTSARPRIVIDSGVLAVAAFLALHGVVGSVYDQRIRSAVIAERASWAQPMLALAPVGHMAVAYDAWTIPSALSFSQDWTGNPPAFARELAATYPGDLYYDLWRHGIFANSSTEGRMRLGCADLRALIDSGGLWVATHNRNPVLLDEGAVTTDPPVAVGDNLAYRLTSLTCP